MTAFLDSATISTTTVPSGVDKRAGIDSATLTSKTAPSSVDVPVYADVKIVGSTTTITANDRGPFADNGTPTGITTPAGLVETVINWDVYVNPISTNVGTNVVFSIVIGVTTGTSSTTVGGEDFVTAAGYWGVNDDDNGVI